MENQGSFILALYDFSSKQEYIYRTSKIKEISGASLLLDKMYIKFIKELSVHNIVIAFKNPDGSYCDFSIKSFPKITIDGKTVEADGQVLYEGGGNLLVMFKSIDIYKKSNNILSMYLLRNYPGLNMISSCVEYRGVFSGDKSDIDNLFKENERQKNLYPSYELTAVTPMTQIDPMTFLPVTKKFSAKQPGNPYPTEVSLSADRYAKANAYMEAFIEEKKNKTIADDSDELEEGLSAVIYIDGNGMGEKLQSIVSPDYDTGVARQREFSENVKQVFVSAPLKALENEGFVFRKVIGGGDEITLICKAKDALNITKRYFELLDSNHSVLPEGCGAQMDEAKKKNTSCAGICVMHAKSPFTVAYEIAEAACENAKKRSRKNIGNYFDFYFCHAGMTADFDSIRKREQIMTGRPYAVSDIRGILSEKAEVLRKAGRANVKSLGIAAQKGQTVFNIEAMRVNAYLAQNNDEEDMSKPEIRPDDLKVVYDIAEFYDLWFCGQDSEKGDTDAADN